MNKAELTDAIAKENTTLSKVQISGVVDSLLDSVRQELAKGGSVMLLGFGTFSTAKRAERTGRHPQTGEPMSIPAATTVKFAAGKAFKELVNPPKGAKGGKGKKAKKKK